MANIISTYWTGSTMTVKKKRPHMAKKKVFFDQDNYRGAHMLSRYSKNYWIWLLIATSLAYSPSFAQLGKKIRRKGICLKRWKKGSKNWINFGRSVWSSNKIKRFFCRNNCLIRNLTDLLIDPRKSWQINSFTVPVWLFYNQTLLCNIFTFRIKSLRDKNETK